MSLILDPDGRDLEIGLTSFQEGIKEWISEIRRQRFEKFFDFFRYTLCKRYCNLDRRQLKVMQLKYTRHPLPLMNLFTLCQTYTLAVQVSDSIKMGIYIWIVMSCP